MAKVKKTKNGNFNVVHEVNKRKLAGPFKKRSKAQAKAKEIRERNS